VTHPRAVQRPRYPQPPTQRPGREPVCESGLLV